MDGAAAAENVKRFVKETHKRPVRISCADGTGLDKLKEKLRELVSPTVKFHHAHPEKPNAGRMPDTTGDEIPPEAMKFATFLKLEKPKAKSHPSRGNIH